MSSKLYVIHLEWGIVPRTFSIIHSQQQVIRIITHTVHYYTHSQQQVTHKITHWALLCIHNRLHIWLHTEHYYTHSQQQVTYMITHTEHYYTFTTTGYTWPNTLNTITHSQQQATHDQTYWALLHIHNNRLHMIKHTEHYPFSSGTLSHKFPNAFSFIFSGKVSEMISDECTLNWSPTHQSIHLTTGAKQWWKIQSQHSPLSSQIWRIIFWWCW